MGEGQRIEGQMFRAAGVRWTLAIIALVLAAVSVLVFGYLVKMWVGVTGNWAAGVGGTGGAGGGWGGGGWAGGGIVIPPTVPHVPVSQVPWPVPREASVREHWEGQQQGIGTWLAGYWQKNNGRFVQYQSSQAISIPIAGEDRFVLVLHVPIGHTPATAPEAQIWVCELNSTAAGQYAPSYPAGAMVVACLNEQQIKWVWQNGLPSGLAAALLQQANATAAPPGSAVGAWGMSQTEIDVQQYFPAESGEQAEDATDSQEPG